MPDTKFVLGRVKNAPVSDRELLADLKHVSKIAQTKKITQKIYNEHGTHNASTVLRRFGTWNKALELADLTITNESNIADEKLFENTLMLWQHYGRQPRRAELASPPSTISQSAYYRRFSSWVNALEHFVEYANANDSPAPKTISSRGAKKAGRDPSLRLRFKVMLRNHFTCQHCGSSPAKQLGVELHIDHIIPWSKGGETIVENLQTLCSNCNLGKSNVTE